jgi:hypothetical protein
MCRVVDHCGERESGGLILNFYRTLLQVMEDVVSTSAGVRASSSRSRRTQPSPCLGMIEIALRYWS